MYACVYFHYELCKRWDTVNLQKEYRIHLKEMKYGTGVSINLVIFHDARKSWKYLKYVKNKWKKEAMYGLSLKTAIYSSFNEISSILSLTCSLQRKYILTFCWFCDGKLFTFWDLCFSRIILNHWYST